MKDSGISNPFTLGGLFGGTKETKAADAAAKKQRKTAADAKSKKQPEKKKGWFGR